MILTTLFGGARATRELTDGTYMIGRAESCRIRFNAPEVSERHAILTVKDGKAILEDLHSSNGTLVNGEAIDCAVVLDSGMVVTVGSGMMRVSEEGEGRETEDGRRETGEGREAEDLRRATDSSLPSQVLSPPAVVSDPLRDLRRNVQTQIQHELLKRMDMKKLTVQGVDREGLEDSAREKIRGIIDEVVANGKLPPGIDPVRLEDDVFNEAMRLGPLEELLADESVTEIMVNGPE